MKIELQDFDPDHKRYFFTFSPNKDDKPTIYLYLTAEDLSKMVQEMIGWNEK